MTEAEFETLSAGEKSVTWLKAIRELDIDAEVTADGVRVTWTDDGARMGDLFPELSRHYDPTRLVLVLMILLAGSKQPTATEVKGEKPSSIEEMEKLHDMVEVDDR